MVLQNLKKIFGIWAGRFSGLGRLWKDRAELADRNMAADLRSFLPPALEIVETPPHPAAKMILWIILAVALTAAAWSIIGQLDIICVAEGKVIPSGKVKEIQPFDRGVVKRILAAEGQLVEEGQPLIELDQTQAEADEARLEAERRVVHPKKKRQQILVELLQ
jgi:hemolysin D